RVGDCREYPRARMRERRPEHVGSVGRPHARAGIKSMKIDRVDHFVLTVRSIEATCAFYTRVLGMTVEGFGPQKRTALKFGRHKINLPPAGGEFDPKAATPTAGSGDFCLIAATPLDEVVAHLQACNVAIEEGPVERTGATGIIRSVYFRDPD